MVEQKIKEEQGFIWTVSEGDKMLGVVYGSTFLTDSGKTLMVELAASNTPGKLDVVERLMKRVEDFAEDRGYNKVSVHGRPGWGKWLCGLSYREVQVEWEKDIE